MKEIRVNHRLPLCQDRCRDIVEKMRLERAARQDYSVGRVLREMESTLRGWKSPAPEGNGK